MDSHVQSVLAQIGLSAGFHIPIANEENVKLEAELQRLILKKARATANLENINLKKEGLDKHLKFVKNEQTDNQNLIFARNKELETEKHQYVIYKMEREREHQEVRRMEHEEMATEKRRQDKLTVLRGVMSKMDKVKLALKWDERAIDTLEEIVSKKDEDNTLIQKFTKEDLRKAEDLEVKRRRLKEEEIARRGLVTRLANEIENMELTIGRNVQMYRQMCEERNIMVKQWQDSVAQLQNRQKDIKWLELIMDGLEKSIAANKLINEEKREFAKNEEENNIELESKISEENQLIGKARDNLQTYIGYVKDTKAELGSVQRELRATATSLENERSEKRFLTNLLNRQRLDLENSKQLVQSFKDRLKQVSSSNLTAEERMRQLEEMVIIEEKNHDMLLNDIERIQGVIFRSQSALADLKETYKMKVLRQKVEENAIVTLQRQKVQMEIDTRNSAETIYKLHFRINMLENRLARASGERSDDSGEGTQAKMRELTGILAQVNQTSTLLQVQITKLEDDMRRMSMTTTSNAELLFNLRARLNDRVLMVDGAVKLVKRQQNCNNSRKVELNVLAVRLKGAEKIVQKEGGVVYDLQRHQLALEAATRERMTEVQVEKELCVLKRRALQDDAGRMRGDIQLRKIRIEQLKKRLECILESLGKSEDGEALSVTYFKVKNAQEKYALQQEGDRLDKLIKKAEQEIVALENTLDVLNNTNNAYKKTLDLLDEDSVELKIYKELEEKYKEVGIELRTRNKLLSERSALVRDLRTKIEEVRLKVEELSKIVDDKQTRLNRLLSDENERKTKMNRAMQAAMNKGSVCACTGDYFIDLATRQYKDVNNSALQQLLETSVRYLEIEPVLKKYLTEIGLHGVLLHVQPRRFRSDSSSISSATGSKASTARSRSTAPTKRDICKGTTAISPVLFSVDIP